MIFSESNSSRLENRLFDAKQVELGKILYVVQIKKTIGKALCTGSLISDIHVLTVAHCIRPYTLLATQIYYGISVLVQNRRSTIYNYKLYGVQYLETHPKFFGSTKTGYQNDIGLIKVSI